MKKFYKNRGWVWNNKLQSIAIMDSKQVYLLARKVSSVGSSDSVCISSEKELVLDKEELSSLIDYLVKIHAEMDKEKDNE